MHTQQWATSLVGMVVLWSTGFSLSWRRSTFASESCRRWLLFDRKSSILVQSFIVRPFYRLRRHQSLLTIAEAARKQKVSKADPVQHHLVIVESPSKCATIAKILNQHVSQQGGGTLYNVLPCRGHIRNLSRTRSKAPPPPEFPYAIPGVDLSRRFAPVYEVLSDKADVIRELKVAAASAHVILLATDADREGEAMAWHLTQVLGTNDHMYRRISFVELTPSAILEAIRQPYDLNPRLIAAQETRRVLDRLAGFTLSPLLWKKISPGLSAGRVQSVGMALVVNRERERLVFPSSRYWKVSAHFQDQSNSLGHLSFTLKFLNETTPLVTKSTDFRVERINASASRAITDKHHLSSESEAVRLIERLQEDDTTWRVLSFESRRESHAAPPSYNTASLQQDAVRKLGWTVSHTMRVAQRLYEEGHITYIRTDSTALSLDAVSVLKFKLGEKYTDTAAKSKRLRQKSKFAQEAHEAVRPAIVDGTFRSPTNEMVDEAGARLYRLIYQRTLASSMPPRIVNRTRVVVQGKNQLGSAEFVATGEVVLDPGYSKLYSSGPVPVSKTSCEFDNSVDCEADDYPAIVPPLREGQILRLESLRASDHVTLPPPRYSEASFVKELDTLGVGRPSTFSKIISILRERGYVFARGQRGSPHAASGGNISARRASGQSEPLTPPNHQSLVPTLSAFAVTSLLETHCPSYVNSQFTAEMEDKLDLIARCEHDDDGVYSDKGRFQYLRDYYAGPDGLAAKVKRLEEDIKGDEGRQVFLPALLGNETKEVGLFVGPWGPYVQKLGSNGARDERRTTAPLPQGMAANLSLITPQVLQSVLYAKRSGGIILGQHPRDGRNIRLKVGRYGAYLQWGDDGDVGSSTHSLPRDKATTIPQTAGGESDISEVNGLSWDEALGYVSLPRIVCHLDDAPIVASIGPYGPYLKHNNTYLNLNESHGDILFIDADTAEYLIKNALKKHKKSRGVIAELGEMDGNAVSVKSGKFGKYVSWKKVNAKLPAEYAENPETLPLVDAWVLIQDRLREGHSKLEPAKTIKSGNAQLPPAPKRPLSAYLHFCAAKRPEVFSPRASFGNQSKVLSSLWSEATLTERELYKSMADESKEKYENEMKAWRTRCEMLLHQGYHPECTENGTNVKTRSNMSQSKSTKSKDAKTTSAYVLFCRERRPLLVGKDGRKPSLGEASRMLAQQWKECSDETRQFFVQQVRLEKERSPSN